MHIGELNYGRNIIPIVIVIVCSFLLKITALFFSYLMTNLPIHLSHEEERKTILSAPTGWLVSVDPIGQALAPCRFRQVVVRSSGLSLAHSS